MSARVGVVVRTRHRPEFLARALADIAAQRFTDLEVIVVNDGGDAATVDAVIARAAHADRIRSVHIAPGEGGRCIAANTGMRATDAEYVVLHDDDDRWHPDFLTRTARHLDAHPEDAAVATATEIVYEEWDGEQWIETGRVPFWAGMTRISLTDMLSINRAVPISVLYRRSVHDEAGWYDESLDAVEDWDLYLRILRRHGIGFIGGEPLALWSQRPAAQGADANSMFDLTAEHARDDQIVRDRALREFIRSEGDGLPLYLGAIERRLTERIDALEEALRRGVRDEIDAHQPVLSRVRRLRRRLRPTRD